MEIKKLTAVGWLKKQIEEDFIHNGGLSLNAIFENLKKAIEGTFLHFPFFFSIFAKFCEEG